MVVAFDTDKRFRSDFKAEQNRISALEKEAKTLDKQLVDMIDRLRVDMARVRGAGGLMVRLTEQLISVRNHRLQLAKEHRATRKDIIDREIRLADLHQKADLTEQALGATAGLMGATSDLLKMIQDRLLSPDTGAGMITLEPGEDYTEVDADEAIRLRLGEPEERVEVIPETIEEGDTVSDPSGKLWILGPDGLEELGQEAEEVFMDPPEGMAPYARLDDGSLVLVVTVED